MSILNNPSTRQNFILIKANFFYHFTLISSTVLSVKRLVGIIILLSEVLLSVLNILCTPNISWLLHEHVRQLPMSKAEEGEVNYKIFEWSLVWSSLLNETFSCLCKTWIATFCKFSRVVWRECSVLYCDRYTSKHTSTGGGGGGGGEFPCSPEESWELQRTIPCNHNIRHKYNTQRLSDNSYCKLRIWILMLTIKDCWLHPYFCSVSLDLIHIHKV